MEHLIAEGAYVNAKGKGDMTPLLWAFPDNQLERFTKLLERGADPNVVISSDFGTKGAIAPGDSVTYLASGSNFPGYFDAVFTHHGDPNFICNSVIRTHDSPIFAVILSNPPDKEHKLKVLISPVPT